MTAAPTLRFERQLLRGGASALACSDEAGRGALSGPVTVAMVLVTDGTAPAPTGVRDSKLLSAKARNSLVDPIKNWAVAWAIGNASSAEIDEFGIVPAMRLAGHRAIAQLAPAPDLILLDGNHDYLTSPDQDALFGPPVVFGQIPEVRTLVKADLSCAAVAAASILAKTSRDNHMIALSAEHDQYGWDVNKGYASAEHMAALKRYGPTKHHRLSWRLPDQEQSSTKAGTMADTSRMKEGSG
ncbi:MAG TPA: ribonuclease HII [Aeromicrobium sp.]|nr:ribonuclease HII [Aeromicrobium sp.]